jgi:hypothetical protein
VAFAPRLVTVAGAVVVASCSVGHPRVMFVRSGVSAIEVCACCDAAHVVFCV